MYGRLGREEILWKFRKIYLWKINSAKFSKRKFSLRFPSEKIRFLKNFRSLSNSSYISFVSVKNLIDVAIQTSWRRRRSLRPSVRIVSSKKPTARKSYVPRLLRWTKSDSEKRKKKESIKRAVQREWPGPFAIISVTLIYLGDNHRREFLAEELSCPVDPLTPPTAGNLRSVLFSIMLLDSIQRNDNFILNSITLSFLHIYIIMKY